MKYIEINKKFTATVAGYIAEGYIFNTATMSGSQGEAARVDLTNGTEIITIYLNKFSDYSGDHDLKGIELVVAHPSKQDELIPNDHESYRTLWLSHVEIISVERFYQLGRDANWYVTEEEAKAAAEVQYKHWERHPRHYGVRTTYITNPKALEIAKQYLIDRRVGKRIDMSMLKLQKTTEKYGVRWYIVYKGKFYSLR